MQLAATVYSIPVLKWGLATVPMMEEEWSSCGSGEKKQGENSNSCPAQGSKEAGEQSSGSLEISWLNLLRSGS